jgi:hypothetical protein
MGIAPYFLLIGAIGATLLLDRAIAMRRPRWAVARKGIHLVATPAVLRRVTRQRIRWIEAAEFAHLIHSDPDLVIFQVIEDPLLDDEHDKPPSAVAVTLEQLAKAIPWIPSGTRIVIYRAEGIDTAFAREVAPILRGRDAMFFSGNEQIVA